MDSAINTVTGAVVTVVPLKKTQISVHAVVEQVLNKQPEGKTMPIRNGQVVKWKHTISIRDLYADVEDESDENATRIGKAIYSRLSNLPFMKSYLYELDEFQDIECRDHLNDCLDGLYDYCDSELIWVEFLAPQQGETTNG